MIKTLYSKKEVSQKGAAFLLFVILFMSISVMFVFGITRGVYSELVGAQVLYDSVASYFVAEAGTEDIVYRVRNGMAYSSSETIPFTVGEVTTIVTSNGNLLEIVGTGTSSNAVRRSRVDMGAGSAAPFYFGMYGGTGGVFLENTSSVIGDLYSSGQIIGQNSNLIDGNVISSGPSGYVDGINTTGSMWSDEIRNSTIAGDIYYDAMEIGNTMSGGGSKYGGQPNQPDQPYPISDDLIDEWKAEAEAGGIILATDPECVGGEWIIDSDTTIGPVKIECDLFIDKNSTNIYLEGSVWVVGNLSTKSSPDLHVDPTMSGYTIPIIVDDPSNRESGSKVILENQAEFHGAGTGSYIIVISQNESAENGGSEVAIDAKNSANGDFLLYASHGKVDIQNSATFAELTAFQIHAKNSSQVVYSATLQNLLFTSGGGGYGIVSWNEVE